MQLVFTKEDSVCRAIIVLKSVPVRARDIIRLLTSVIAKDTRKINGEKPNIARRQIDLRTRLRLFFPPFKSATNRPESR